MSRPHGASPGLARQCGADNIAPSAYRPLVRWAWVAAILAAVVSRQQTGRGQAVDVSLFGAAVAWLPTLIASLFSQGQALAPGEPTLAGGLPQYGVYVTADGRFVALGALEPKFLLNFLGAVGRSDLASAPGEDIKIGNERPRKTHG